MNSINFKLIKHKPKSDWFAQQDEFKILMKEAQKKSLTNVQKEEVLNAIKNGDSNSIDKLVDSTEIWVLTVISQINLDGPTLQEMFNAGRNTLMKLANRELNSTAKEQYFSYGHWWLRQTILSLAHQKKI